MTPSQNTYSYQQPYYAEPQSYPTAQAYPAQNYPTQKYPAPQAGPLAVAAARPLPGIGAAIAVIGAGLAAVGMCALHWVGNLTYTDIFKTVKDQPTPAGGKAEYVHNFLAGGAYGAAGIGLILALLWCCGVMGGRTGVRATIAAVQALLVATQAYGVYEYFDGHFHSVGPGVWLTLAGSVALFAASVIGPRFSRPQPTAWQ